MVALRAHSVFWAEIRTALFLALFIELFDHLSELLILEGVQPIREQNLADWLWEEQ